MNTARLFSVLALAACLSTALPGGSRACELMGISAGEEVQAGVLFDAFRNDCGKNDDGWGVAFYRGGGLSLFREATDASRSPLAKFLAGYAGLKSRTLIGHVRQASVGQPVLKNTHPFVHTIDGRQWALAHNGTLKDFQEKLPLGKYKPVGQTDSEHLLCFLLGQIRKKNINKWGQPEFEWLQDRLRHANELGSLNTLFSDGDYLFVYHDRNGYNGLHFLGREKQGDNPKSVLIATRPLTEGKWSKCVPGQLYAFKEGEQVFPRP